MKNFYYLTLMIFLLSCNSEFKDKSQARNEVNKQGFRDGRWVDYLDESGVLISDTNNNNSYLLSEYKDGNPINKFKEYYKSGVLKSEGEFLHDSIKYDKNTTPKVYINRINVYDMGGKPMQIINYSNTGIILNESFKAKDDSLNVIYQYYNQNIRENFKNIKLVDKSAEINIVFTVNSWFTDTSKYTINVQNKISKDMKGGFSSFDKDHKLLYNKLVDLFTKKRVQLFSGNILMKQLISDGKVINMPVSDIFSKSYNISSSRGNSETLTNGTSNGSSDDVKSCSYCGKTFYKNQGYVVGPSILCAKNYSSAMNEIAFAAKAGYSKSALRLLMADYELGEYYCSKKCVYESGTSMCPQ